MKTSIENITPTMAAALLANNKGRDVGNRPYRDRYASKLAEAIKRGEWLLTHQGIAICEDGRLLDGQHRLSAIVKAGITVPLSVSRDVSAEAFYGMDQGARRSSADILGVDARDAQTAAFIVETADNARPPTAAQTHKGYVIFEDEIIKVRKQSSKRIKIFTSAPFRAVAAVLIKHKPQHAYYVLDTYRRLADHVTEDSNSVVHTLLKARAENRLPVSTGGRAALIYTAMWAFDPDNAEAKMYRQYEASVGKAVHAFKAIVRIYMPAGS